MKIFLLINDEKRRKASSLRRKADRMPWWRRVPKCKAKGVRRAGQR